MADIVLINPSVNLKVVAGEMKLYGNRVKFVYTEDIPLSTAQRIFYFMPSLNYCFTTEAQGEMEKDDRVLLLKNNIISKFKMMGYRRNFIANHPELEGGNFSDYILLKRSMLRYEKKMEEGIFTYKSFDEVCSRNKDSYILASIIAGQGDENICFWETDMDIHATFSSDYFIFFTGSFRIEAYVYDNYLITIGKSSNHIDVISSLVPMFKKFSFKKINTVSITRNYNPWVMPAQSFKGCLINDYSFGNLSISMPALWYDKMASFININIEKIIK